MLFYGKLVIGVSVKLWSLNTIHIYMRNPFKQLVEHAPAASERKLFNHANYKDFIVDLAGAENDQDTDHVLSLIRDMRKEVEDAALENKHYATVDYVYEDPGGKGAVKQAMDYFRKLGFAVEALPPAYKDVKNERGEVVGKKKEFNGCVKIEWARESEK